MGKVSFLLCRCFCLVWKMRTKQSEEGVRCSGMCPIRLRNHCEVPSLPSQRPRNPCEVASLPAKRPREPCEVVSLPSEVVWKRCEVESGAAKGPRTRSNSPGGRSGSPWRVVRLMRRLFPDTFQPLSQINPYL